LKQTLKILLESADLLTDYELEFTVCCAIVYIVINLYEIIVNNCDYSLFLF